MKPRVAILTERLEGKRSRSPVDIGLLVTELRSRGREVDVMLLPSWTLADVTDGWPSLFLGNLDFSGYDQVIGTDECALLVRRPGAVAWLSEMPFERHANAPSGLRKRALTELLRSAVRAFVAQGGRLWAGSGYLSDRIATATGETCETLPIVPWHLGEFRRSAGDPGLGQVPYFALFDVTGPSAGLVRAVASLSRLGRQGPSLVVCSEHLSGNGLQQVLEVSSDLAPDRLNVFTGERAARAREVLFDNALGVVSTDAHVLYPRVIFEAARSEKPIIVMAGIGGSAIELVTHGHTGFACFTDQESDDVFATLSVNYRRAQELGSSLRGELQSSIAQGPLSVSYVVDRLLR